MVEHRTPNPGVGGSSPSWPAIFYVWKGFQMAKRKTRRKRTSTVETPEAAGTSKVLPLQKDLGHLERIKQFLYEVKVEFKKITWPSRKETISTTVAVISFTLFISFYLGLVDAILSKIVQWLVY